jgi:hypothetical protein
MLRLMEGEAGRIKLIAAQAAGFRVGLAYLDSSVAALFASHARAS